MRAKDKRAGLKEKAGAEKKSKGGGSDGRIMRQFAALRELKNMIRLGECI